MTEGSTTTPGPAPEGDSDLAGVPLVPPGAEVLAVVSVVLYRDADGTEGLSLLGVNAEDAGALPTTTTAGILALALGDLAR